MKTEVDKTLIEKLKKRIRSMSDAANEEVKDLVLSAKRELEMAGVYGDENDPTYYQAIVLYCKGNYGYDDNVERFRMAFGALRDAMYLSGEYKKEEGEQH